MSVRVLNPGLQSTLQATRRVQFRHMGMPYSGPADSLSHALANRIVLNGSDAATLEVTFGQIELEFAKPSIIALAGAVSEAFIDDEPLPFHLSRRIKRDQVLRLSGPRSGARAYLAIPGGFITKKFLGSGSTYIPAGLGGETGQPLQKGDQLRFIKTTLKTDGLKTPAEFIPVIRSSWTIRTLRGPEFELLSEESQTSFFSRRYKVGMRSDRMGIELTGAELETSSTGKMKSVPVFPGTIQCPESGDPYILSADAQTTGGYPRIASIARCDRHMLGQLRPGDTVQFLERSAEDAHSAYVQKQAYLSDWLGLDFNLD